MSVELAVLILQPGSSERDWIAVGALGLLIILFFLFIFGEQIKKTLGATAAPLVNGHNESPGAHPREFGDLRTAIGILTGAVESLQKQIDAHESMRKESIAGVLGRLELAIRLLQREHEEES